MARSAASDLVDVVVDHHVVVFVPVLDLVACLAHARFDDLFGRILRPLGQSLFERLA